MSAHFVEKSVWVDVDGETGFEKNFKMSDPVLGNPPC